jgi:CRP-like cAMP-binding protein
MKARKAQGAARTIVGHSELSQSSCAICIAYELNLCQAAAAASWSPDRPMPVDIDQHAREVDARKIICREQDLYDTIPIICGGWAASVILLPNGTRQILSFLLPGDMVSTALLFEPIRNGTVEAITAVRYRMFKRTGLKTLLFSRPDLLERVLKSWVEEKARSDQLIVDLGRRSAEERIARMVLNLVERLARRGMVEKASDPIEFPLRQHHIADATGLTPVHVSKVLSDFRRRNLMTISERTLTIPDPEGFRHIAQLREH